MNVNTLLFRILMIILGTHAMSFAWPLRGQFGGAFGATITGGMAACIFSLLIPWKKVRQAFAQGVFWGTLGFTLGSQNIPYGALIDNLLLQPNLNGSLPTLLTLLFIGASWGAIGATYLGYGVSEKAMTFWDYLIIFILGVITLVVGLIFGNPGIFIAYSLLIILLHLYNFIFKQSDTVWTLGLYGLIGFGLGFLAAVLILFWGSKGLLPGPPDWWTLRDQMWGAAGGLALILASWKIILNNQQPIVISQTWFQRVGFIFFIPVIGGLNLWDVFTKWFQSTPPAPNLLLSGILIAVGVILLAGWLIYYLIVNAAVFTGPGLNPLILWSFLFSVFFLRFFAIAKSIVYSGWGVWETGFTITLFESLLFLLVTPFILLGQENP